MAISRTRRSQRALILLAALAALGWFIRANCAGVPEPTDRREPGHSNVEDPRTVADLVEAESAVRQLTPIPPPRSSLQTAVSLKGRVIDELCETPVVALLRVGESTAVSRPTDGGFSLEIGRLSGSMITVGADGYEAAQIEVPSPVGSRELTVRLRPTTTCSVAISSPAGHPLAGVEVVWGTALGVPERGQMADWISSEKLLSGRRNNRLSDAEGISRMPSAVSMVATIIEPDTSVRESVLVRPGCTVPVELSARALELTIVDDRSGLPVGGLEIEYWYPCSTTALSQRTRTTVEGIARVPVNSFPILVRRPGSSVWQEELVPETTRCSRIGTGGDLKTMLRIDSAPEGFQARVRLRKLGGSLILARADTQEPYSGPIRFATKSGTCPHDGIDVGKCTMLATTSDDIAPDEIYDCVEGRVGLPGTIWRQAQSTQLFLIAQGFEPLPVDRALLPRGADQAPLELGLTPTRGTRWLQILESDGRPCPGDVRVYSPRFDAITWASRGEENGLHGPFNWYGGDIVVSSTRELGIRRVLTEGELAGTSTVQFTAPADLGSIVVTDLPYPVVATRLIAKYGVGVEGVVHTPSRCEADRCVFTDLRSGSYMVGPAEWVRGSEMQSMTFTARDGAVPRSSRVDVAAGSTTIVPWNDFWRAGATIKGSVQLRSGNSGDVFLVALYGVGGEGGEMQPNGVPRAVIGRRSPRIPIDPDGNYEIEAGQPIPILMLVCTTRAGLWGTVGDLFLHDTMFPGESIEVETASLELRWQGDGERKDIQVDLITNEASYRVPVSCPHSRTTERWAVTANLQLRGLPAKIAEIRLGGTRFPVTLTPGRTTVLGVQGEPGGPLRIVSSAVE